MNLSVPEVTQDCVHGSLACAAVYISDGTVVSVNDVSSVTPQSLVKSNIVDLKSGLILPLFCDSRFFFGKQSLTDSKLACSA